MKTRRHRLLASLVLPVAAAIVSACGGASAPEAQRAPAPGAAAGGGEICPTGDPTKQPCPQGCTWDEKAQKCMKDRGIIVDYGTPPPPPPPPPPGS